MKTAHLPPVRIEPGLRTEIEALLDHGETLSEFVIRSVKDTVEWRRTQDAFLARADIAVQRMVIKGGGETPEQAMNLLDQQLATARAKLLQGSAPPAAA